MANNLKYLTVKQTILNQIQNGELKPDDKLPSEEEYIETFGVSGITIRKALSELAAEGYISRIKRKGTFVNAPSTTEDSSHLIALILSAEDYYDNSYMKIIKGAQRTASEYNYSLVIEWSSSNLQQEEVAIHRMLDRNVDGFLIYPFNPSKSEPLYHQLEEKNIPYVLVDSYNIHHPCYFSGCDNYVGGVLATKKLLDLRHTKIKFAGYHFFLQSEKERYDGFCGAMREAGLEVTKDNLMLDIDYEQLKELILHRDVTAIFCCNDKLALKVINALTAQGIKIPQDVSIIGYDDWANAQNAIVSITTIRQDFDQIGANAAYLLISALQGKIQGNNTKIISGVFLVERDSTSINPYC